MHSRGSIQRVSYPLSVTGFEAVSRMIEAQNGQPTTQEKTLVGWYELKSEKIEKHWKQETLRVTVTSRANYEREAA